MRHQAVQRSRSLAPVVIDRNAVAAHYGADAPAALEFAARFETARENQAVHFVFGAVHDKPALGDPFDALR